MLNHLQRLYSGGISGDIDFNSDILAKDGMVRVKCIVEDAMEKAVKRCGVGSVCLRLTGY